LLLLLLLQLLRSGLLGIRQRHRIGIKRQQAAKLTGNPAYRIAQSGIAECATNRPAQRLSDLTEQIAEPALRCQLLLLLQLLLQLLQLCLLRGLLRIGLRYRIVTEWQQRAADAACKLADLRSEVGIAE